MICSCAPASLDGLKFLDLIDLLTVRCALKPFVDDDPRYIGG